MLYKKLSLFILCILSFCLQSTHAIEIKLAGQRKLRKCSSAKNNLYFYCKNRKGEEFFVKASGWNYLAFKSYKLGKLEELEVQEIEDKNGQSLFSLNTQRGYGPQAKQAPSNSGALVDFQTQMSIHTNFLKYDLGVVLSSADGVVFDRLNAIKERIESKKSSLDEQVDTNKLKVRLDDNSILNCQRDSNSQCPILSCDKDKYGQSRLLFKERGSDNAHYESFAFSSSGDYRPKASIVTELISSQGTSLVKRVDRPSSGVFEESMLVPGNYKSDPELFKRMLNYNYINYLGESISGCSEKLQYKIVDASRKIRQDYANAKMIQYIAYANGSVESYYINEESLPENSCYYRGAYYTQEGFKRTLKLEPATKKTVSYKRAKELFDQARARKDIAWDYTYDGCYARAHLMADMFEKQGVHVDKAWLRGNLKIPGDKNSRTWGYHVAPLVYVEDSKVNIKEMIIDPSVSDKPISAKKWAQIMEVDYEKTKQVPYPTPTNTAYYNGSSYSVTNSTPYWPHHLTDLDQEEKMDMAKQTMLDYGAEPVESQSLWDKWEN